MTDWTLMTLKTFIEQRLDAMDTSLKLQADEYERRLTLLNHAHEKAIEVQNTYVSEEKYDDYVKNASANLELALERTNEKFDDYVKRYEQRQREVDQAIAIQKGAAEQAQRIAEEQGRKSNRNMAITTAVIIVLVAIANFLGTL